MGCLQRDGRYIFNAHTECPHALQGTQRTQIHFSHTGAALTFRMQNSLGGVHMRASRDRTSCVRPKSAFRAPRTQALAPMALDDGELQRATPAEDEEEEAGEMGAENSDSDPQVCLAVCSHYV
jgi:hypothetical protein